MLQSFNDLRLEDPTDSLRSEVVRLQTIIASMEQSWSWRLTRPIRIATKFIRIRQRKYYKRLALEKDLIIQQSPMERASQVSSSKNNQIPNVCGIAHVYYTDLADEIVEAFFRCGTLNSVIITSPTPSDELLIDAIRKLSNERPALNIAVLPVNNIGRDIYPFLQAIQHQFVLDCDVFLKIHTKKSLHLDEYKGRNWRQQLLVDLCHDPEQTSQIATSLYNDHEAWVACPKNFAAGKESCGRNSKNLNRLTNQIGIAMPKNFMFPAGSMFWAKKEVVNCLNEQSFKEHSFYFERNHIDGTLTHAIERLIGVIPAAAGKKIWLF
jgi:lipopolysaccharide biosynthesis protein